MSQLETIRVHRDDVRSIAFLSEEEMLTASRDKTLIWWVKDLDKGPNWNKWTNKQVLTGHSECVNVVKTNPNKIDMFASGSDDKKIIIYKKPAKLWRED